MNKLYKIIRDQTLATLKEDFTLDCLGSKHTYKKGATFNVKRMNEKGVIIVLGHGIREIIPRELFDKYTRTWVEVFKNGDTTIHKNKKKDVTKEWNEHWDIILNKEKIMKQHEEEIIKNLRVKDLKKLIKFVKSGQAEKELASIECAKSS